MMMDPRTSLHPTAFVLACVGLLLAGCPQFPDEEQGEGPNNTTDPNNTTVTTGPNNTTPQVRSCGQRVEFAGAQAAASVTISGEFNGWDDVATPLAREGGVWSAVLDLEPGQYAYKFVVDGEYEGAPPPEVYTKWDGGFENRALIVEDCALPTWEVLRNSVDGAGEVSATLKFVSGVSGDAIDPTSLTLTVNRQEIEPASIDEGAGTVEVRYQAPSYGKYTVRAVASDTSGREVEGGELWLPMWHEEEEFVWQDATMYLIFTDRFLDSDGGSPVPPIQDVAPIAGYMGGDFKGIVDKIEEGYFNDLGVNLLWLSPVYENSEERWVGGSGDFYTGYHGYWPIDPLNAETRYGDTGGSANERLQLLIDKAHERGIRVLFDVVHNHVHEDHTYCATNPAWCELTCTCGSDGCGWDDLPLICQFASYLPDLSYQNHDILTKQVDDTVALAAKFDVDGLRVDAAKHMDHVIMRTLRGRLNELEEQGAAPFYTVGETYTFTDGHGLIMEYVADYELHGQFDFPLLYPIRDVFGKDTQGFVGLEAAVKISERVYGDFYEWMSPFLGNHDIPRFVTEALGNDFDPWDQSVDVMGQGPQDTIADEQWNVINRMSMGFAFLLTQPGIPLIYYGDEVGLAGAGDPDNRRMMDWTWNAGQQELYDRVKTLGQARQALEPLRRGARKELWVDDTMYVYARVNGPGDVVIVAMNKGEARSVEVTLPTELGLGNTRLVSYNSDREVITGTSTVTVELNNWEYAIFSVE